MFSAYWADPLALRLSNLLEPVLGLTAFMLCGPKKSDMFCMS